MYINNILYMLFIYICANKPSMKKRITVKIKMDQYLVDFMYAVFQPGETHEPLFIPKRHKLNKLLSFLLVKPPEDYNPFEKMSEPYLELIIPYFEKFNINTYNYLSRKSQRTFAKKVMDVFDIAFFEFVEPLIIDGIDKIDAVNLFIEKYNQPDTLRFQERLTKKLQRSLKFSDKKPKKSYKKWSV